MLVTSTANMSTGITTKHLLTVRAWAPGHQQTTLDSYMIQRKHPVSSLTNETSAPTQTWPSRASTRTASCQTDVSWEISRGHNIGPPSWRHQDSRFLPTAIRWSVGTFSRLIGSAFDFSQVNSLDTTNIKRAYQDFGESLLSAAKQCIPRGRRKNYVPCWDKECETLCCSFTWAAVGTDSDRAASSLLSRLEQKKQER